MAMKTYADGDVLYADDLLEWLQPKAAYRTGSQSVVSSTVLVNDTALSLAVDANAVYLVELGLVYEANTADGDIKIAWTGPAGAALSTAVAMGISTTGTTVSDDITVGASATPAFGGVGAGSNAALFYKFLYTTSATPGTLQLQWAQNISSTTPTVVKAGSYLTAQRTG